MIDTMVSGEPYDITLVGGIHIRGFLLEKEEDLQLLTLSWREGLVFHTATVQYENVIGVESTTLGENNGA